MGVVVVKFGILLVCLGDFENGSCFLVWVEGLFVRVYNLFGN